MAGAARVTSRNSTTLPPQGEGLFSGVAMNNFQMEASLEQRERLRALQRQHFERQQRELAMQRSFGEEMDRERALLIERERVERMIERDRMGNRMVGMSRMFERERDSRLVGGDRPIGVDRRLDGPVVASRLDSGSGASRLENVVGLDRRSENAVDVDRRLESVMGVDRRLSSGVERRLENAVGVDRRLENAVAVERRLESGVERRLENSVGMDRRVESGVDRRLETAPERDDDRDGARPALRPASFERLRSTDRERDEERDRAREDDKMIERGAAGEKPKERDDSAGAMQELVAQYKTALAELTFNSKPIITNLTIIAGENLHAAKGVADTVCAHILEVPIEQKLPSLYLLDSIVKNIGSDYVKHFAARLPEVFIEAYRQVDPSTYPAMQHLFKTWRGVFPVAPLRIIEAELRFSPMVNGSSTTSNSTRSDESPSQRPGRSIHVNPKYLEAQRQKLQQSSRVNEPLPRIQKGDGLSGEPNYGRKSASSFSDYDYGSADPGAEGGSRVADREKTWERGWPREGEDALRPPESGSSLRYGLRNGYELRQPSPRALVDAYGNIRGIRAPRLAPTPVQPAQDLDSRSRGLSRNWQNSEEEEYIWEDMSPRLLDHSLHGDNLRKDKDDWYPGDADKNLLSGGSGGGKPLGVDRQLPDHFGWRRHGPLPLIDRPTATENRLARETEERAPLTSLQQDVGPGLVPDSALEIPALGPSNRSMMAHRPLTGRLVHSLPQQLSLPAQSKLRPLQVTLPNRNPSPAGLGSLSQVSQAANLSGPSSSSGTSAAIGLALAARASVRPAMGSSLGGGLLNFGSLSPVTPASGLNFQQRQQLQRPPSPPSLAPPSQPQLPPPPPTPPLQHQPNFPSLQQRVNQLKPVLHQGQAPGMQPHSSQQPPPLHPLLQQPQPVQQLPHQLPTVQQAPQQLQPLHALRAQQIPQSQSTAEQVPAQQPSQTVPILPQLPSQLLQSLQQLQHHLPPLSGSPLHQAQATQPPQPPFQLQSPPPSIQQSQSTQLLQQQHQHQKPPQPVSQTQPQPQLPPQPLQNPGYATPPMGSLVNDNTATSALSGSQSHSSTNNLLAAFLQSGLMPPSQASQILSHPHPSSPKVPTGPSESTLAQPPSQVQPPLPSGPPPIQFPTLGTGPLLGQVVLSAPAAVSTLTSTLVHLPAPVPPPTNLPPTYASQLMRMVQPPLPPGPPPMSSQVVSSTSQPPSSGGPPLASGNNLSSLLSSLVAQGLISGPSSSAPPTLPQPVGVPNMSLGAALTNLNPGHPSSEAPLVPPVGSSVPAVTVVSTTLVTAFPTQDPSVTTTHAPTETSSAGSPIGIEFRQEILRERHEAVINALYSDFPRQCKTCGLRFKFQEEHSKHMDWHVSRNRRQKSSKKVSRKWFVSVKEWLSGTGASASEVSPSFFAEDVAVKSEEHEAVAVPADENQSACALCGEPFEDFYSDETEEWMYRGAVYMNAPPGGVTEGLDSSLLGPIVHAKCRSESAATAAADSGEDDEVEEEDELGRRRKRVRY